VPSLLEEGDQEVDAHVDVLSDLFLVELVVTDGGAEAEHLLQLELNGSLDLLDLISDQFVLLEHHGELADLVQGVTEELGDLLHQGLAGQQDVVGLGPALNGLLLLVELLQALNVDEVDADLLGLLAVDDGSHNCDLELGVGDVGKLDRADETLFLFGIVVSQADLQFDGFGESSLFFWSSTYR